MPDALLSVENLDMRFGGILALQDVSFAARRGQITAIIGPNGAGKTTLFNCVTGMYAATGGRIKLEGQELTRMRADQIARAGIARTFQNIALFEGLSVLDNLKVGLYRHGRGGLLEGALRLPRARREEREAEAKAREMLSFLGLAEVAASRPGELSYGVQKQVEFGRALMQSGRLLLLDEPMAGMTQSEKQRFVDMILHVRESMGVSFLLVEHDMQVVMDVSDHIVVLDFGRKIAEGTPREVQRNEAVIAAYLGGEPASQ